MATHLTVTAIEWERVHLTVRLQVTSYGTAADITSIKQAPVAAMLRSQAEVVGLHPMTAPPKAPTLKGKVLVICEARLDVWRDWLSVLFDALQAECVRVAPEYHDRAMALIQAMVTPPISRKPACFAAMRNISDRHRHCCRCDPRPSSWMSR